MTIGSTVVTDRLQIRELGIESATDNAISYGATLHTLGPLADGESRSRNRTVSGADQAPTRESQQSPSIGLECVLVTCDDDVGSAQVIENRSGVLENVVAGRDGSVSKRRCRVEIGA
jgi:hypothetical protein